MAAINQSNSGVVDREAYSLVYDKELDDLIKKNEQVPKEGLQFVDEMSTNSTTMKVGAVNQTVDLPIRAEDPSPYQLVQSPEGQSKEFTNLQYELAIGVWERAITAQKNRQIMSMLKGLPNSFARKVEYLIADLFNSGFDTQTTADGAYIFDETHYKDDPEAGTWGNEPASGGGFTTDTLFAAWQHFENMTDEKGFPQPQSMSEIVYPVALYEDVMKVLNTGKYPDISTNAESPWTGTFKPTMYHWLTSSDAWFARGNTDIGQRGFMLVNETKPLFRPITADMVGKPTFVWGQHGKMVCSVGAVEAHDWFGNSGS